MRKGIKNGYKGIQMGMCRKNGSRDTEIDVDIKEIGSIVSS